MENLDNNKYLTVEKLAQLRSLTVGGLRKWLYNRQANGLDSAVIRVGRKLLISTAEFDSWLESHKEGRK